jgi:hypothetical protein
MLVSSALNAWSRTHHGPRVQARAISYIAIRIDIFEGFSGDDGYSLTDILHKCKNLCVTDVSVTTLFRWWKLYIEWGELPYLVKIRKLEMKKKMVTMGSASSIDKNELLQLKSWLITTHSFI